MISDIRRLKKIDDILNSEGTVLGLFQIDEQFFLGSFLKDHSGMVYYSVSRDLLKSYFDSKLKLRQVYLASEDIIVTRKCRNEIESFLKNDFAEMLQCGDQYYHEIGESMRNDNLANQF